MKNIKRKFENETKTRINIVGSFNSSKINLIRMLVKQGIFNIKDFISDNYLNSFPTEMLCSSTKSNIVTVYLNIKKKEDLYKDLKGIILEAVYEASLIFNNENIKCSEEIEVIKFKQKYISILNQFYNSSLNNFYEVDSIEKVFELIKFDKLLSELKEINNIINQDILEDKDDVIWEKFFGDFEISFQRQYFKWMKRIFEHYTENEEGYEYVNQHNDNIKYSNNDFDSLCKIIYGRRSSCALMIERAYIKAPSSKEQFVGNVYIYYTEDFKNRNVGQIIENRISEAYKEVFVVLSDCSDDMSYFSMLKERINKATLDRKVFCILDEFNSYRVKLFREQNKINYINSKNNFVDSIKMSISRKIGISSDKIIVTEQFNDIDKITLQTLNTNDDFINLLKLIKLESESIGNVIKIKPLKKERIISISLNQERMSVQALMGMLYERYNGYLVDLWKKIIEYEESSIDNKKYNYSTIRTLIRSRKDSDKEYKYEFLDECNQNYKKIIDFSLRSGDYNDSKKILKMLVNYGYNTVGFNSNENKIIVTVNGEISKEDKDNLVKLIKGRLEESAINYFESAFLKKVSQNKFNANSLHKALECEKNITIDDFYSAFKEIFEKMSYNIMRYEVCLK